ncbi:hypothetical protein FIU28_06405 [Tardiphaga sp. vice154]|uniref:cellulose biosynthesis protein BcsN n=1 Tax=Tardiphaga sp. vice154 TaxID=2592814 RepID=UPI00116263B2|nr:cellulose biosynthesis protein BcsN [Tardiphaga sp. vice154]QDM20798.1 hypothetical protein FIU28_06405 [Tardiphaga sp. vice154]
MIRVFIACLIAAVLCGCSQSGDRKKLSFDELDRLAATTVRESNASAEKAQQSAFARLPADAGRVVRVSRTGSSDGIHQQIELDSRVAGLGPSMIDIRIRTSNRAVLDQPINVAKPTEASIRAELLTQFPRMAMQVVKQPHGNDYGPYGLAVGRWENGSRCIYAWQWIDDLKIARALETPNPASIRIRLCRNGGTLDLLAGMVDQLSLDPAQAEAREVESVSVAQSPKHLAQKDARSVVHHKGRHVQPTAPVRRMARAEVSQPLVDLIPPSTQGGAEQPLDTSLPAAAYRGPAASGSTQSK